MLLLLGCGVDTKASASTAARPATTVTLHTLPDLHPPILRIDHPANGTAPGYVMFAQKGGKDRPSGTVIADNRGRIVWFHEVPKGLEATDFRTQTYRGRPVLTWWQGIISKAGIGRGTYEVYDASYHEIATVKAAHGLDGDLHEFQLTPRGTAYITIYHEVPVDLRSVGGPKDGYAEDSIVQEIDVKTGKVALEWHSLDHVPLTESIQAHREPALHATKKRPLDYFHVNSIADGPGGTILISGRNTSALYLIRRDGSIVWRLGGKRSDFGPAAAVKFRYQHDARFHGPTTISLFDNGAIPKEEPFTRPLVLRDRLCSQDGEDREDVRAPEEAELAVRGKPRAAARRRCVRRVGRHPEADRVFGHGPGAIPGDAAVRRHVPRLPVAVDRRPGWEAARLGRRRPRLCELEREARDRTLAGARRTGHRPPRRDRLAAVGRA